MIGSANNRFTPASLTNVYERWRTDTGVNLSAADAGGSVFRGSVNGLYLSNPTVATRPTLLTNELNGFSALSFVAGSSTFLSLSSFAHTQPYGFMMVYKATNNSAGSGFDEFLTWQATVGAGYILSDTTPRCFMSAGTNLAGSPQVMLAEAKYSYLICYLNGTASWFSLDGRRVNLGDAGAGASTQLTVGGFPGSNHWTTLKLVELAAFGALATGEDAKLMNYCRREYRIVGAA